MRKCDFETSHAEFEKWVIWYGDFIKKIVDAERVVKTRHEKKEVVESIVLKCAARWVVLVEHDIVSSLNRDPSVYASAFNLRLRQHLTRDECKAMLIGHRFLDFKSVGDVKPFGKRFLVQKVNPFSGLTSTRPQS